MKPDGVAAAPSEPMEAERTEPVTEPAGTDSASQNGTTQSPPQPDEPQNEQVAPPKVKEATGKAVDAKSKSKGPIKGKTTAAGPATTGPGTRPKATQSRLATNGLTKMTASTLTKKPIPATNAAADKKKPTTTSGPSGLSKKPVGSSTTVATSRPQPKVTTVGTSRTTTTTTTTTTAAGTKTGAGVGTASSLNRRPATAATSAATKPKSTAPAPRPATAPAAKPSNSAKATAAPKTNRSTVNSAPRPATTSTTTGRATTTTTTALTRTSRTATQPVKPLVSASAAGKDVGKTSTTALGKKTAASTLSRLAASKSLNSDAPKSAAPLKRPPPATKAPQLKPEDKKSVPTRKVPPSPRNNPSRLASGKSIAASPSHKQAGASSGKLQPSKPTQSVLPIVVKGKPNDKDTAAKPDNEEPVTDPVQLSAAAVATVAVATAAVMAKEEFSSEPEAAPTAESSLQAPTISLDVQENVDLQLPNVNHQNMLDVPTTEPETHEVLLETDLVEEAGLKSLVVSQESEEQMSRKADEKLIAAVAPVSQEAPEQETTVSTFDISAATVVPSVVEVAEKAEPVNSECFEDVEEEEREGSQQVSLSEMSGTQPTEESRPGSAGLAGSVWRAGALLSELDSEDVSCSQQGASELSAPGVLEGTESMDDLGDASLKGADGEGASVGSPDFEKVPDILNNEDDDDDDDDDEDRVCDMEVGSERAEDSHRQLHDNDDDDNDDDDDEDVEMASEGITESGLESYGNADEDDLTEDYRLDNLNRIQPPVIPSAPLVTQWNQPSCFADAWAQPPQPASTLLTSPSSECWQADPETPTEKPAQSRTNVGSKAGSSSPLPSNLFEPPPCSPQLATLIGAEGHAGPKQGLTPSQASELHDGMLSEPDLASETNRDTIIPENVEDYNNSGTETHSKGELQQEPINPVPTVLPDIMQDLGIHLECAEEEQPETLPAEDVLGGPATVQLSSSSATEDEASDTEGEMQISDPQAELPGIESAFGIAPVGHNLPTLEEHEEVGGENEVGGGGGSETPQSATSAASYGFDYMTSNSNAQSSAESCSKSPGIFSLENEEQLPDEAKDPSLLKELTLIPATGSGEKIDPVKCQHGEFQANPEHQYMLCGESRELLESDSVPGAVPVKSDLTDPSPQHLEEEQGPETQHPYYSTICEKTDSTLAERNFSPQPNDLLSIQMTMSSKLRLRPRASYVSQPPRLPTDLPPRIPNAVSNTQLRCLEQHQQHLHEIQQRQEKRNREQEKQQTREEMQVRKEKQEEEEEQRRNLLELKLKQQEQELKQRQQIMQWQQDLEQQQQQKHKVHTPVILSPLTGLTTIYETVETSDSEDGKEEGKQSVVEKLQDKSSFIVFPGEDTQKCTEKNDSANLYSHCSTPSPESATQDSQQELKKTDAATDQDSPSPLGSPEQPLPLEFDWGKKVDIVQQLINQTLLLTGDGCSPLLLLPGRAGGTLSPLESSLWPNLLPPLTPPSATVTSVSSFSPEAPGSSAQGEWTVVELETHH